MVPGPFFSWKKETHLFIKSPANHSRVANCEYLPHAKGTCSSSLRITFWWNNTYHLPSAQPRKAATYSPYLTILFPSASWTSAVVLEAGSWRHRSLAETIRGGDDWERSLDHPGHRTSRNGRTPNFRPSPAAQLGGKMMLKYMKHVWYGYLQIFLGQVGSKNSLEFTGDLPFEFNIVQPVCRRNLCKKES